MALNNSNHSAEPHWRLARRNKIVTAASELFGRAAYDAVQMDHVADQAKVSKPTLYRYFPSKDELFLVASDAALADLEQALVELSATKGPAPAVLARMIETLVEGLGRHVASLHLLTDGHSGTANRWRRLFNARRRPIVASLRTVIERGVAEGDLRPVDADVVPRLLLGMIRGGLVGAPKRGHARIAATAVDLLLNGAAGSKGAGRRAGRAAKR